MVSIHWLISHNRCQRNSKPSYHYHLYCDRHYRWLRKFGYGDSNRKYDSSSANEYQPCMRRRIVNAEFSRDRHSDRGDLFLERAIGLQFSSNEPGTESCNGSDGGYLYSNSNGYRIRLQCNRYHHSNSKHHSSSANEHQPCMRRRIINAELSRDRHSDRSNVLLERPGKL